MFSISQRTTMVMAALLAATTGSALAQTVDPAQVRAEAVAANKAGLIAHGELGAPEAKFVSIRSVADVRSEAVAAVAAGQTAHGERGYPEAKFVSAKSRAEVNADAVMAVKSGLIPHGEG